MANTCDEREHRLSIRCSEEFKARVEAAAKADDRTLSNFVIRELTKVIERLEREVRLAKVVEQMEREAKQ